MVEEVLSRRRSYREESTEPGQTLFRAGEQPAGWWPWPGRRRRPRPPSVVAAGLQPALDVDGGHAPRAGGRDGLAVDVVLDVAAGEDAFDVGGRRPRLGD